MSQAEEDVYEEVVVHERAGPSTMRAATGGAAASVMAVASTGTAKVDDYKRKASAPAAGSGNPFSRPGKPKAAKVQ